MVLRAVFLDVGNTLVFEVPSRSRIYAEAAARRGAEIGAARMGELMLRAHRELPKVLDGDFRYTVPWFQAYIRRIFHAELGLEEEALEELSAELFARFDDPRTFRLFPGTNELLDELRGRGLFLGAISNWSPRLPGILEGLGLEGRLDLVVCSAIEGVEKPDPAIFETALGRAGVRPAEALHAGDNLEKDVRGALGAGIGAVLVDHAGTRRGEPEAGVPSVGSLGELLSYILERCP